MHPHSCTQELDEAVDKSEVLGLLVADGQEALAERWAASLGRDYQVRLKAFEVGWLLGRSAALGSLLQTARDALAEGLTP